MTNKQREMKSEIRSGLRGGNGDVKLLHLFSAEELSGKAKMCAKITLEPGCSIGEHSHCEDGELYIITNGRGTVDDNGVEREVLPGDAVWTTGGEYHSVTNNSNEPLEMYAIVIC